MNTQTLPARLTSVGAPLLRQLAAHDDMQRLLVIAGVAGAYAGTIGFFLMVSRVVGWVQGL